VTLDFSRVTLAGPLWTVAEVKSLQLKITDAAHDSDVQEKLDAAEEYVLAYLGAGADPSWTPTTAPKAVKKAILGLTTYLYEHRGDDVGNAARPDDAMIWNFLQHMLSNYRDPALA
jgi:hypothetical protein